MEWACTVDLVTSVGTVVSQRRRHGPPPRHVQRGPDVKMLKLAAGADIPAPAIPFQQARFIIDGGVEHSGHEYPGISFLHPA